MPNINEEKLTLKLIKKAREKLKAGKIKKIKIEGKYYYAIDPNTGKFIDVYKYRGKYFDKKTKKEINIISDINDVRDILESKIL